MISSKKHELVALSQCTKSSPAPPRNAKISYFMQWAVPFFFFFAPIYLAIMDSSLSVHLVVKIWKVAKQARAFKASFRLHQHPF